MSEATIKLEWYMGTVALPRPTGQWVQDPDGWWRELMTDWVEYDGSGREVSRKPHKSMFRMSCAPYSWMEPEPWWRRLLNVIGL